MYEYIILLIFKIYSKNNKIFILFITVVDMCTSSLRALILAYGWMLPREAEMVSE